MRIRPESIITLHPLYQRKELDKYIIGEPQTGEFMYISGQELKLIELLNTKQSYRNIESAVAKQKDPVDVKAFLHELKEKGFIHKVDNHVIKPLHEPLHELNVSAAWLGGPTARFLLMLITLFGLATLIWFGTFPSYLSFFYQQSLTATVVITIIMAWFLVAARQFVKHAASQYLNVQSRFGFSNAYHVFTPQTHVPAITESQQKHVLGMSLLSLTALTSIALMLATFAQSVSQFWYMVYAIGVIELLCECLLFLDTDLAKFISATTNIHKLNKQTKHVLHDDVKYLFKKGSRQSHHFITTYAFFYIVSIILAILLLAVYIIPAMIFFLYTAFERFTPGHPLFVDGFAALLFFSIDLLLYAFAVLRHHPLSHNTFFINMSLAAITVSSYILAAVGIQWFALSADTLITIVITYVLGLLISLLFEASIRFAHPFYKYHTFYEKFLLPLFAACIPVSILYTVIYATPYVYVFGLVLGIGMLSAIGFRELWRITAR